MRADLAVRIPAPGSAPRSRRSRPWGSAARETCGAGAKTDPQDGRLRNPAGQRGGLLQPRRLSSALWSLLRADGASGSWCRRVQCHGGANERLERLFIDLVALMEIDGTPGVAFEAGVEEAGRVRKRSALGEGHFDDILVRLT